MPEKNIESNQNKNNKAGFLIFFLLLIIAVLIGAVIFLFVNKNKEDTSNNISAKQNTTEKRNVVVNKDNVEELIENLSEEDRVAPGNYEVIMSTVWNFFDGESISNDAYVENSEANTNDVYFDVYINETEEKIFESPVLPIGSYLENIKLDKVLKAGTYDCVIVYSLIDEEQNVLSDVRVSLTINIKE